MRRLIVAITIVATAALVAWVFLPAAVPVETARVARGDLTVSVEAEGEAEIREVVVVSAPLAGTLERVTLDPGDSVTIGQVVARIGPVFPALLDSRSRAVAEALAAAAAAEVELARSELMQAEAMLDFARSEAERARALFARSALPERELDDAILSERRAQANVASARAGLAAREKQRDSAEAVLDSEGPAGSACCIEVRAPVAGRILRVLTEDEQVVQPGTPIMEIGDPADLVVVAHVLSRDAVGITPGAGAAVTGWGGADLAAQVQLVEPSATTRVSALGIEEQRVEVRLSLRDDPPPTLGHGFRIYARITVMDLRDVLRVPIAALFRVGGEWAVYAVEGGRARVRLVTLGPRNEEHAEVRGGLADGDTVILHPSDAVGEGVRIAQ